MFGPFDELFVCNLWFVFLVAIESLVVVIVVGVAFGVVFVVDELH